MSKKIMKSIRWFVLFLLYSSLLFIGVVVGFIMITPAPLSAQEGDDFSSAPLAAGQQIRFEQLTQENGLSQSVVNAVERDKQGFMWFGTQDGLNRYDGYNFTVFCPDPKDPQSLSATWITVLYIDLSGALWVGTQIGLNRFDSETKTFTHFRHNPDNPNSLANDLIWFIHEDRQGILWLATEAGLDKFDPKNRTFTHYTRKEGLPNDTILGILENDIILPDMKMPVMDGYEASVKLKIIPHPMEELKKLHHLAMSGVLDDIATSALELKRLDKKYTPFAQKLAKMAANFEDEEIIELLEWPLEGEKKGGYDDN